MKPAHSAVLLWMLAIACSPAPRPPVLTPCLEPVDAGFRRFHNPMFDLSSPVVGFEKMPVTVRLVQPRTVKCALDEPITGLITQVTDPENRPVEHVHTEAEIVLDGEFAETKITFTPDQPGSFHLSARFEPQLGTSQADVPVVRVLALPAAVTTFSLGGDCSAFEVLPSGLGLCLRDDKLLVYRNDVLLQTLDAVAFALAGDIVWSIHNLEVQRLLINEAAPAPLESTMAFNLGGVNFGVAEIKGPFGLFGNSTTVLVSATSLQVRLDVEAGALKPVSSSPLPRRLDSGCIASSNFEKLFCTGTGPSIAMPITPQCLVSFTAAESVLQSSALTGRSHVLGADGSGVWRYDESSLSVDRLDDDGKVTTLRQGLLGIATDELPDFHFQNTSPFAGPGGFALIPRVIDGAIAIEGFPPRADFSLVSASSTHLRVRAIDGGHAVIPR